MVAHQTIGIDMTSGLKGLTLSVNIRLRLPTKDVERVTGTGSADLQQMLISWRFPMFSTVFIGFEVKTPATSSCHEIWRTKR